MNKRKEGLVRSLQHNKAVLLKRFPELESPNFLNLSGTQVGQGRETFNNKNPKGVCIKDLQYLLSVMVTFSPKTIFETGTYTGFSSLAMAYIAKKISASVFIRTVDVDDTFVACASNRANELNLSSELEFIKGNSDIELKYIKSDMVFLDGDPFSKEFELAINASNLIVGHDIYHYKTNLIAPRGTDFIRQERYSDYELIVFETGEAGIGVLYR